MRGPVFACAIIPRIAFIANCRVLLLPLQKVTKQIPIEHLIPIFHMAAQGQMGFQIVLLLDEIACSNVVFSTKEEEEFSTPNVL